MAYTLDSLYGHLRSDGGNVFYGSWEPWFSWRPVKMLYWHTDDIFTIDHPMKMHKTVWLKSLIRRRIRQEFEWEDDDTYSGPTETWQYTTFEELMRWG